MNTNAKKHAFKYILDSIDGDGYGVELTTDKQKIDFVYNTFTSEYAYQIKYYGNNKQRAFREYLAGLPSCINIEFRNYYILELAKLWGSIPSEPTERQEEKIISNWFAYISTQFFDLRDKLNHEAIHGKKTNLETV